MPEREEVEPPWVVYPRVDVTSGFFRQGKGDTYMGWSFNPYFASLTEEEQQAYLKKWNVPDEWKLDRFYPSKPSIFKDYRELPPLPPFTSEGIGDGYGINKVIRRIKDFLGMRPADQWPGRPNPKP